jgi:hypothetical protein
MTANKCMKPLTDVTGMQTLNDSSKIDVIDQTRVEGSLVENSLHGEAS